MAHVQFSDSSTGASAYTLWANPIELDLADSVDQEKVELVDDSPAWQQRSFDGRPKRMAWGTWPVTHASFSSQVTTLRGYIGAEKYINFGDIDYDGNPYHDAGSWRKFLVVDLTTTLRPGGNFYYDRVELLFQRV